MAILTSQSSELPNLIHFKQLPQISEYPSTANILRICPMTLTYLTRLGAT